MQRSTRIKFLLIIVSIAVLVRLPFVFHDVINPDEGSFALMGQDIIDGNLPYDKLWDLKPPLLFCFFAATIAVFGKSIPAIRVGGLLCALAAAWLIFLCAERLKGPRAGFIAALLFIITSTFSESGAGTVSEIVAVVPLTAAMLVMLKDEVRAKDFFFAGFFISLACLVRLNLCYVALAGGMLLLSGRFLRPHAGFFKRICTYVAGGGIPLALVFLPYVITGKERVFATAMIYAPLIYSNSQMSLTAAMHKYVSMAFEPSSLFVSLPIWACIVLGSPKFLSGLKDISDSTKSFLAMSAVFGAATALSILKSGPAFGHYIIQVLPFAVIIAAFFLDGLFDTRYKPLVLALSLFYLILPVRQIATACEPVLSRGRARMPSYEIAGYLKAQNPGNKPVYFMGAQMAEWLLGARPLLKEVTTPSNIGREYILKALDGPSATTYSELAAILDKKPEFIVKPAVVFYLMGHPKASALLSEELLMNYEPVREIGGFFIYRRI
ncbi:MAG: glycosyltransferase family 39 protein [Syntrophobacteraceae bacterium]|nr:glycosyltransferase family 39 protein [Syntrophobacteraceae bacterium]